MVWMLAGPDHKVLKVLGKIAVSPLCCCGTCLCDPMPNTWQVCLHAWCGNYPGTMVRAAPVIGCDPKWVTPTPIIIECRSTAFPEGVCGYFVEVSLLVCYQNGICVISMSLYDPTGGTTETMTKTMSGSCNPFYHYSEWDPVVIGRCTAYASNRLLRLEMGIPCGTGNGSGSS